MWGRINFSAARIPLASMVISSHCREVSADCADPLLIRLTSCLLIAPRGEKGCSVSISRRRVFESMAMAGMAANAASRAGRKTETTTRSRRTPAQLQIRSGSADSLDRGRRIGQGSYRRRIPHFAEHCGRFDAAEARRDARTALAFAGGRVGLHVGRALPRHRDHSRRAGRGCGFRGRAIRGIFRAGTAILCNVWVLANAIFCWGSTMVISPSSARSA